MTDPTRTAWSDAHPDAVQVTNGAQGGTFSIPKYILQANRRYPAMAGANSGSKYYVMMSDPKVADVIGLNWPPGSQSYVTAIDGLDIAGTYNWFKYYDPATACEIVNQFNLPTAWVTRHGSFDYTTQAPGVPLGQESVPTTESPVDAPVPLEWPAPEQKTPATTHYQLEPNEYGNFIGGLRDPNAIVPPVGGWPGGSMAMEYDSLPGDVTVEGLVKFATPDPRFFATDGAQHWDVYCLVQSTAMAVGRRYYAVIRTAK